MVSEFVDCITELQKFDGNILLVKGKDNTFCSGADLSSAKQYLDDPVSKLGMCALMQDSLTRLRRLPIISIACIEGYAIGGGAEITSCCDYRIMASDATIHFIHGKLGLVPGWGGASRLTKILGRQKALEIIGKAMKLNPSKAMEYGYIQRIVEHGKTVDEALDFADDFIKNPSSSIHAIKQEISNADDNPLDSKLLECEREIFSTVWGKKDNIDAFNKNKYVK